MASSATFPPSSSKLFRFPVRRGSSSDSTSSTGSSSVSSILERTRSSSASSIASSDSEFEAKEAALESDIKSNCIGKQNCKCNHCHIGDFVFETEEEFLIYYEALKDVLEAKDSHRPMQIHCQETGARHFTA